MDSVADGTEEGTEVLASALKLDVGKVREHLVNEDSCSGQAGWFAATGPAPATTLPANTLIHGSEDT